MEKAAERYEKKKKNEMVRRRKIRLDLRCTEVLLKDLTTVYLLLHLGRLILTLTVHLKIERQDINLMLHHVCRRTGRNVSITAVVGYFCVVYSVTKFTNK